MIKATERKKASLSLEQIEGMMDFADTHSINGQKIHPENIYRIFIRPELFVSNQVISELVNLGYKIYVGDFDGFMKNVLIIEW